MGGAEEVLSTFGKRYNHLPQSRNGGLHSYKKTDKWRSTIIRKNHDVEMELKNELKIFDKEYSTGTPNTHVTYLNIATMKSGDVFVS